MKKYLAFTTRGYRVFQFFLIPLAAFAIEALSLSVGAHTGTEARRIGAMAAMWFLTAANVLADYWAFAGVAAKGAEMPVYLKTSPRGRGLLSGALAGQMAWTFLEVFLVSGGMALAGIIQEGPEWLWGEGFSEEKVFYLILALTAYVIVEAMVLCARHFDHVNYHGALMGIGGMLFVAVIVWPGSLWPMPALLVLSLLAAAVSRLGVKVVMGRLEESYGKKEETEYD